MINLQMKKLLSFIAFILLLNLPISCDDCGESTPQESTITELTATIGNFESGRFSDSRSSDVNSAAIQIEITGLEYSEKTAMHRMNIQYPFIRQAFACSPPVPEPVQQIKTMQITSTRPVFSRGKEFAPGVSLNALFNISNRGKIGIDEFITVQNQDMWTFGVLTDYVILQLTDSPDTPMDHVFHIVFEFDDAVIISMETDLFKVE